MFGPPGIAYVYLVYGMHECLNVVTEPEGRPAAVLIRAVEPVEGLAAMRAARARRVHGPRRIDAVEDARIASGPGLVTAAFDITRAETGADLLDPQAPLRIEAGPPPARILATPRIGIAYAAEPWRSHPWRLIDPDSPSISGARRRGSAS